MTGKLLQYTEQEPTSCSKKQTSSEPDVDNDDANGYAMSKVTADNKQLRYLLRMLSFFPLTIANVQKYT